MIERRGMIGAALAMLVCGGCATGGGNALPAGAAAHALFPAPIPAPVPPTVPAPVQVGTADAALRAGDRVAIRVLGEPELTSDQYRVDERGYLQLPLAGDILAAGKPPADVRADIAARLAAHYIRAPQVAVAVIDRRPATFTVEGDVNAPGIFAATADTTLLAAIAQARSPTDVAKLDEVMIFRTAQGRRMGARFNLHAIRTGAAPDPQVLPGDTVVVGHSALRGAWHQFLKAAPAFSIFYYLRN